MKILMFNSCSVPDGLTQLHTFQDQPSNLWCHVLYQGTLGSKDIYRVVITLITDHYYERKH